VRIKKLYGKPIVVVADAMGTVRLFNYPNVKGEPYYQCYSDHLSRTTDVMVSADMQYLLTASAFDRCVFKWKIKYNDTKI
jgi:WD40 repeat protein